MQLFKRLSLIIFVLFISSAINAQKIDWGVKNKAKSKLFIPAIVHEDGESIFSIHADDDNIILEKYNSKGGIDYSTEVKLDKINGERAEREGVLYLKDRFVIFASCYDDKNDKAILYALSYDGKTGRKIGKEIKLMDAPVERAKRKGSFYIFGSEDRSKFLINHYAFYKKEGKYRDRYKLFDNEMNSIVEKNEVLNKKEIDYRTFSYHIDNDGSVYFLKKVIDGDAYIVSYDANKDFEKWEEKVDVTKLDKNQSVGDLVFKFDNNNDLVIAGICRKKEKSKGLIKTDIYIPSGVMYMKIDKKSKEVKAMKISDVKMKSIFKRLDFDITDQSIHFTAKNELVFINEALNTIYHKNAYTNFYAELFVIKFGENGDVKWSNTIPKMQQCLIGNKSSLANAFYFSYVSGVNSDNLYVIYNDNPKNFNLVDPTKVKTIRKLSKAVPFICTINLATGKCSTKQFFDPKVLKTNIRAMFSVQKDYKSDIVTMAMKRNEYQMVRIKLDSKK